MFKKFLLAWVIIMILSNCGPKTDNFQQAIYSNNINEVKYYINKGADVNEFFNSSGTTAIDIAIMNQNIELVELLIKHGVNLNKTNEIGHNVLHHPELNLDIAQLLIDNGIDVNSHGGNGFTPLYTWIMNGNIDMITLLLDNGSDINIKLNDGQTVMDLVNKMNFQKEKKEELIQLLQKYLSK